MTSNDSLAAYAQDYSAAAMAIYQPYLDVTSQLVLEGDHEAYSTHISLPYVFRTERQEEVAETLQDLRNDVIQITNWLRSAAVTDFFRIGRKARFTDTNTIEGYHVTYALNGTIPVIAPYWSRVILRRVDGRWLATLSEHELSDALFISRITIASPGLFAERWNSDAPTTTRNQHDAWPIYQVFINSMSDMVNTPDFDAWCAHFTFPHEIHYDATDHIANTPDDVRVFFDMIVEQMQDVGATSLIRNARYVEFLSDDRIFGYHETIIVKDGTTVFGPVKSRMMLTFSEGRWKCSSVTNSLSQQTPTETEFKVSGKLPTMREIQERMRK